MLSEKVAVVAGRRRGAGVGGAGGAQSLNWGAVAGGWQPVGAHLCWCWTFLERGMV